MQNDAKGGFKVSQEVLAQVVSHFLTTFPETAESVAAAIIKYVEENMGVREPEWQDAPKKAISETLNEIERIQAMQTACDVIRGILKEMRSEK